ncbi:MAK16 protein, putative [Eimeria praecox]|uniref:MAK16 protein, putative n=1 Tax=Eimeria praecox TaxID=51316 RepID=U6G686_9EIME|nr:MAK16 protein, putative [Eimeria praecox]
MIDRMRRLELKPKEKLEGVKKKTERREAAREKKALVAAHIEDVIEDELLKRLHQGVYGDLYNEHRLRKETTEEKEEAPQITEAKAAEAGAIRFEAAADTDEEEEEEEEEEDVFAFSDSASDADLDGASDDDEFSFSGSASEFDETDSEEEESEDKTAKTAIKEKKRSEELVDVEELQPINISQKKRKAETSKESTEKRSIPVATLRRQAAKSKK